MAASFFFGLSVLAAAVSPAVASCAYGTHLHPRAAEGEAVPIGKFGYAGAIVSRYKPYLSLSIIPSPTAMWSTQAKLHTTYKHKPNHLAMYEGLGSRATATSLCLGPSPIDAATARHQSSSSVQSTWLRHHVQVDIELTG